MKRLLIATYSALLLSGCAYWYQDPYARPVFLPDKSYVYAERWMGDRVFSEEEIYVGPDGRFYEKKTKREVRRLDRPYSEVEDVKATHRRKKGWNQR